MAEIILSELYPTPWGIVESRRSEIESGGYGIFERVLNEEIYKLFYPLSKVAQLMDCHPSTARKWLWEDNDPRYIVKDGEMLYHKDDAIATVEHRKSVKAAKKQKSKEAA